MYANLEAQQQKSDEEWEHWKEQWAREKTYYLNRIKDLEELMGIGEKRSAPGNIHNDNNKEFFKKRMIEHARSQSKQP